LKLGWWLLTILYSGGIWWFSSRTGSQVGIPAPVDEVHQAFVPLRSPGLDDWLADLIGAFLGAMLGGFQVRQLQRAPEARASIKQRH
jgi:VanZ family protein